MVRFKHGETLKRNWKAQTVTGMGKAGTGTVKATAKAMATAEYDRASRDEYARTFTLPFSSPSHSQSHSFIAHWVR